MALVGDDSVWVPMYATVERSDWNARKHSSCRDECELSEKTEENIFRVRTFPRT